MSVLQKLNIKPILTNRLKGDANHMGDCDLLSLISLIAIYSSTVH